MSPQNPRRARLSRAVRLASIGLAAWLAMAQAPLADSIVLPAAQDATLIEDPFGGFANGSGPAIFAGRIATVTQSVRRALVRFDVGLALPAGSTITSVRLSLNLAQTNSGASTMRLHRVTGSWGEGASVSLGGGGATSLPGDATWMHRVYDDVLWSSPGGDFDPAPRGEAIAELPGPVVWESTPEMILDVQSWLDDPEGNFGWMVIGDESLPQTAKRFDSRESPEVAGRPALEVVYTPPCLPDPLGPGDWRQECGGIIDAATRGCAGRLFEEIGLPEIDACSALLAARPSCDERAARKLAVLVLNVCANRLQTSCPSAANEGACDSDTVGALLFEMADLMRSGNCRRAAACGGLPD